MKLGNRQRIKTKEEATSMKKLKWSKEEKIFVFLKDKQINEFQ